jgi:nucleotide-binding universal stress UspA family protein
LLARPGSESLHDPERALVCTDFSAASESALDVGGLLAKAFGARTTLLHVVEESGWRKSADEAKQDELEAEIRGTLARLHGERLPPPVLTALLVDDAIADAIVQHAAQCSPDIIVVATHGRTGVAHLLIGSVAERVARHAACSVLVTRSTGASYVTDVIV